MRKELLRGLLHLLNPRTRWNSCREKGGPAKGEVCAVTALGGGHPSVFRPQSRARDALDRAARLRGYHSGPVQERPAVMFNYDCRTRLPVLGLYLEAIVRG